MSYLARSERVLLLLLVHSVVRRRANLDRTLSLCVALLARYRFAVVDENFAPCLLAIGASFRYSFPILRDWIFVCGKKFVVCRLNLLCTFGEL